MDTEQQINTNNEPNDATTNHLNNDTMTNFESNVLISATVP